MTFSGSLQQVDQHEGFELIIASGETMTYSGSEFDIGGHTFKLSGGGTFNNTNNLTLDNSGSKLAISDSTKISNLSVSASNVGAELSITGSNTGSTGNIVGDLFLSGSLAINSDTAVSMGNLTTDDALVFSSNKDVNIEKLGLTGSADVSLGTENITLTVTDPVTIASAQKISNGSGSFEFISGTTLESGGELVGQGQQIKGTLELKGGKLSIEKDTTFSENLTISEDSIIKIENSKTMTYGGAAIEIGAAKLKIEGGGSFINSANTALKLNNANSNLVFDSVNVGYVSVSVASDSNSNKGLEVLADSTVTNLSMSQKLKLSVATTKTLIITDPLVIPSSGMELSGSGKLDLSDNLTMNGDVTLSSGSLILDATGLVLNLGGNLNLSGGTLLTDNNTYIHLLSNSVLTTDAEQIIANVTIEENTQPILTLGSNTTILKLVEMISFPVSCPQSLPFEPKDQLKLMKGISIDSGTELCIDGWLEGDIVLNGGTLRIDADTTINSSSALSIDATSNLKFVNGASLTYEGSSLSLDNNTLLISSIEDPSISVSDGSGEGSLLFKNDGSNPLSLNNPDGVLEFSGDRTSTVSHVKINSGDASNAPLIKMSSSGVINSLTHTEFSEINIGGGKTLSITEDFVVPGDKQLRITGAEGILSLGGNMTLTGTLSFTDNNSTLDGGNLALNGGILQAEDDINLKSNLLQSAESKIVAASGKTINYSGASLSLGANTLRISGGGAFSNTNSLVLDDAASKLHLSSITVGSVSTSVDNSLGVVVENDSTISNFAVSNTTPVSIASGKTLEGSIGVTAGSLKLTDTGSIASAVSMSGGTTLDADNSLTVSGALTHAGDITIDVAGTQTLTYTGTPISLGEHTLKLMGGGSLLSGGLDINNAASKLLLSSITVDSVSTSVDDSLGVVVENDSTISNFAVSNITPVSIASGKTLEGSIGVTAGSLKLTETGTLASAVSMSGGTTLDADNSLTVSGALTHTGDITIDVAGTRTLTYTGAPISLGEHTLKLMGGGSLLSGGL
ncbi:MAG: hypothetical protein P8L36_08520, partial [SAR324 cluster bacterium]|nr:hypothetical protein [SAR324 cluster bacterium]